MLLFVAIIIVHLLFAIIESPLELFLYKYGPGLHILQFQITDVIAM